MTFEELVTQVEALPVEQKAELLQRLVPAGATLMISTADPRLIEVILTAIASRIRKG